MGVLAAVLSPVCLWRLAMLSALVWPFMSSSNTVRKGPAFGLAAIFAVVLLASLGWMFKPQTLVSATEAVPVKPVAAGEEQKTGNTGEIPPTVTVSPRWIKSTSKTLIS